MCIGNLRSATQNMCDYVKERDVHSLHNGILYFGIIAFFIFGAIMGNIAIGYLGGHAIFVSAVLLAIAFSIMFIDREKEEIEELKERIEEKL